MSEHSLHILLIAAPLLSAFFILFKDKINLKSKFTLLTIAALFLYTISFATPMHLFHSSYVMEQNSSAHMCCISPTADVTPLFELSLKRELPVEGYISSEVVANHPTTTADQNKSPPIFA